VSRGPVRGLSSRKDGGDPPPTYRVAGRRVNGRGGRQRLNILAKILNHAITNGDQPRNGSRTATSAAIIKLM
jgi:hypothetical protein